MGMRRLDTVVVQTRLSAPGHAWLKAEAVRLGISPSELLRRIVDGLRGEMGVPVGMRVENLLSASG